LPKIGPEKALGKIMEYLSEIDRLKNVGHINGESQKEDLNYKIKAFIKNAFDNPGDKVKEYDNYVNMFFAVVGEKKSSQEKENDYQLDLREMKTMLLSYREELEMVEPNYVARETSYDSKEIFIVHGHDEAAKYELARIIHKEFRLEAKILHEEADKGRTIIEKLEGVSHLPGYAFVLLTPDDLGAEQVPDEKIEYFNNPAMKLKEQKTQFKYRARQNVIFELGYFIGLLGRDRVCCLYKEGVELPSDFSGVLYQKFRDNISEITWEIRRELKAAGYNI
jgi:predicted nucleotide-binding protein